MDLSAKRSLIEVGSEWHLPQIMGALKEALSGHGPALRFAEKPNPALSVVNQEIAVVVATSGSTGEAKEVGFSSAALLASAEAASEYLGATAQDRWSLLLPLTHIAGLNVLIRSLIFEKTPVDLRDGFDKGPDGIGFTAIVGTQLHRAIEGARKEDHELLTHLQSVRKVLIGGGPLDPSLKSKAANMSIKLIQSYGSTETSGGCIYEGEPLKGVEVKIINDRIAIKGATLASYYLNLNDQMQITPIADENGWYESADYGSWEDGQLTVLGRVDDIIISGGKKISLSLIENIYRTAQPGIDFASFSIPDAEWGEKFIIAADKDLTQEKRKEIEVEITRIYGSHAVPKELCIVDKIPRTALEKLDKSLIIAMRKKSKNF